MTLLIESFYFPIVPVFEEIIQYESIMIQHDENYQKQSFRNRTYIATSNGVQKLIVPILHTQSRKIVDIKIDYSQKWQQVHTRSIKTAYGKSAFFEYYFEAFEKIILQKHTFLIELNMAAMSKCLELLKSQKKIVDSNSITSDRPKHINDRTSYYTVQKFSSESLPSPADNSYFQVFGSNFVKNLSILDLLFNEGTNATSYLLKK